MMSTLKCVVGPYHTTAWEIGRLSQCSSLAQLHYKYWGVSMKKGNDDNHDGEEGGSNGDNFIDGCHVLDVGISGMEASIWVRAEYIRIFDHITKVHNELVASTGIDEESYCVILTGQPGIGKLDMAQSFAYQH